MYDKKSIVKWNIQNALTKRGFGTELCIEALQFNGNDLRVQTHTRSYMTNPFNKHQAMKNNRFVRNIGSVDKIKPSFSLEKPFDFAPNIVKLDTILCVYLIDTDNNFFLNNYPYINIDAARFDKEEKKFFSLPTNGLCVLPVASTDEFIDDMLMVADNQHHGMFAKKLSYFVNGNMLRFQKTK